ncbi:hypothetical protein CsSME_00022950 [Camellia sinensis var. sinensis]
MFSIINSENLTKLLMLHLQGNGEHKRVLIQSSGYSS